MIRCSRRRATSSSSCYIPTCYKTFAVLVVRALLPRRRVDVDVFVLSFFVFCLDARGQDERNIINGLGEIMKLALVRSTELFSLLELHGPRLVRERFQVRRSPITAVKVLPPVGPIRASSRVFFRWSTSLNSTRLRVWDLVCLSFLNLTRLVSCDCSFLPNGMAGTRSLDDGWRWLRWLRELMACRTA